MKYKSYKEEERRIRDDYRKSSLRKNKYDPMEKFFAIQELEEQLYEERKEYANCSKEGFCGRLDWDNCNDIGCGMHRVNRYRFDEL